MANNESNSNVSITPSLGLTGATMNAMALIAPGAFLWITYQLQASATAPNGSSVASDIWAGIGAALILAFLTAISYAELARIYPEAGFGSCYYFAEKAFLDREKKEHHKWARLAKIIDRLGCASLLLGVPGSDGCVMATLIGYMYSQFTGRCDFSHRPGCDRDSVCASHRLHRYARRNRLHHHLDRHQCRAAHYPGDIQRARHLLSDDQSGRRDQMGLQQFLGCRDAALAGRRAGAIHNRDSDSGRVRKLHGSGGGNQESDGAIFPGL